MTILAEFAESLGLKFKVSTRKVGRG